MVASGLLDTNYTKTFNKREFVLEIANSQRWGGNYDSLTDTITHKLTYNHFKDSEPTNLLYLSLKTSFHENAHYFWKHNLSTEQQDEFRKIMLEKKDKYFMFKQELDNIFDEDFKYHQARGDNFDNVDFSSKNLPGFMHLGTILDRCIYEKYGFTQKTFSNFTGFMSNEQKYKDYYGESFDNNFYGTEAFAYLSSFELYDKYCKRSNLESRNSLINSFDDSEKQGQLAKIDLWLLESNRKDVIKLTKEVTEIQSIPKELVPFYKGFMNPVFFKE